MTIVIVYMMLLLGTLIGLFFTGLAILLREYLKKISKNRNPSIVTHVPDESVWPPPPTGGKD